MSESTAGNVVIAVFVVVTAVVIWDTIKKTGKATPPFKTVVALTILAAGLALGVAVAPSVVGPFALLVGLAIVLSRTGNPKGAHS